MCGGGWRRTGKEEECKQRVRDIVHVKIMPLGLFLTLFNFFFLCEVKKITNFKKAEVKPNVPGFTHLQAKICHISNNTSNI